MTSESLQNTRNGRSRSNSCELFDRFLLEAELQQNGTEDFEQKLRKVTKGGKIGTLISTHLRSSENSKSFHCA